MTNAIIHAIISARIFSFDPPSNSIIFENGEAQKIATTLEEFNRLEHEARAWLKHSISDEAKAARKRMQEMRASQKSSTPCVGDQTDEGFVVGEGDIFHPKG